LLAPQTRRAPATPEKRMHHDRLALLELGVAGVHDPPGDLVTTD
jgi:hypothetical protein